MSAQQLAYLLRVTATAGKWSRGQGYGTVRIDRALKRQRLPGDDEVEPNDTRALASARDSLAPLACLRTCTVRGILGTTDDRVDFWRVRRPAGRSICKRVNGAGVQAAVVRGPRGYAFVRVTTKRPLANYTLRVRVC
jgi:hypothetical protein